MTERPLGWRTVSHRLLIADTLTAANVPFTQDYDFAASEEHVFFEVPNPRTKHLHLFIAVYATADDEAITGIPYAQLTVGQRWVQDSEPLLPMGDQLSFVGLASTCAGIVGILAAHYAASGTL